MMKEEKSNRIFRFLISGAIAAAFNLFLISFLIDFCGWNTPFLKNVSNIISIEASLILSFFIYRIWVWKDSNLSTKKIFISQLLLYHFSASVAIALRVLLIFPLLDILGVSYSINTLLGVALSASFNYVISDRLVFRTRKSEGKAYQKLDLYPPEGLAPTFVNEKNISQNLHQEFGVPSHRKAYHRSFLLSVVIPAYNEEGCIQETVEKICQCLEKKVIDYEILIVNDNSRDNTEKILKQIAEENSKVRYVNNHYPNGFGFAVRCGLEKFQGDGVVIAMADASDPPEQIVNYYYKLREGYECVFGSRFIKGGWVVDYPKHKLFVNRLANFFIKKLVGIDYNDTTNAFKAYKREVIEGVAPLISHHFNLTVEIPLKAIVRGYSYNVIPIGWCNRKTGISKLKLQEMGSRYLFIVLYILLEKFLSRGDYVRKLPQEPSVLREN